LDSTDQVQMVFSIGRRSIVLATLEYMILAFGIALSILYTTEVIFSGLSAAIFDLMVVSNASSVGLHVLASAVPDRMTIAFEIFYFVPQVQPVI
jgi:hypothetical protein